MVFVRSGGVGGPGEADVHERTGVDRDMGDGGMVELVTTDSTAVPVEIDDDT